MRHEDKVQEEFARQAESFRDSPALAAQEITTRIGAALGGGHARVLDMACGPGILFPTLSACAQTVVGIDLTRESLRLAREADVRGASVVRARGEQLPFAAGCFDAAVLRLALHHFQDPAAALASARSVLRAGGRLVVLDLLAPEDAEARALRDALERIRDPSHARLISLPEMRRQLRRAGFGAPVETLWSRRRQFAEWARIINEPRRMADLEQVLRALARTPGDPAGLDLRVAGDELSFCYRWGLFAVEAC